MEQPTPAVLAEDIQLTSQLPEEQKFEGMKLILAPDPVLQIRSADVVKDDIDNGKIANLIKNMTKVMTALDGIGLSAVQVNVLQRIFILDNSIAGETKGHKVFINPVITNLFGRVEMNEGCLSFPGLMVKVVRAEKLTVTAVDEKFEPFTLDLEGLGAIAVQHENDHLNGITFLDQLSKLKRDMYKKKYDNLRKRIKNGR